MDASLWLVLFGAGTLLLRVATALHLAGAVRSKNSSGAVLRCVTDLVLGMLAFWLVGYAFFDTPRFRWNPMSRMLPGLINWREIAFTPPSSDAVVGQSGGFFFLLTAAIIAGGIVVGAVAERARFWPMAAASVLLAGLLTPVAASSVAQGWLSGLGFSDFAWAGPIHLVGAAVAVVAVILVGPRMGKYNRDGSSNAIPGHNLPLLSVGVLLSLVGWIPYILGFAVYRGSADASLAQIVTNVLLAAAAGAAAALLVSQMRYSKPDIHLVYIGLLGALVAISAMPAARSTWMAVVVGAVAGVLVPAATLVIDLIWKLDDPSGGIAVHGVGALWGLFAAGLFGQAASFRIWLDHVSVQILGIVTIPLLAAAVSAGLFLVLRRLVPLRAKEADEYDGLDLAEHDINAYPDFQQTMIKSYHLREA